MLACEAGTPGGPARVGRFCLTFILADPIADGNEFPSDKSVSFSMKVKKVF
jgi:hypothetical protein